MFVDSIITKWSSANSLTASLRVQQILYQLSPTCVCPNFSGMLQELQNYKLNTAPSENDDGPPRHLIALALETSQSLSSDSKLPHIPRRSKARDQKRCRPRMMSEDLIKAEKPNDIEMLFQNPPKCSQSNPRNLSFSRKSSMETRNGVQYRRLAEGSVKLAMSCWSAGRKNVPMIRIHDESPDDSSSGRVRSSSLDCIEMETLKGNSKIRALSTELVPIPLISTTDGISYSSAEFDDLRASIYSIYGSVKSGSLSPMAAAVLENIDSAEKESKTNRKCRSLSDIKGVESGVRQGFADVRWLSDLYIDSLNNDGMADLFETANILGQALERHLKQQASVQTV
ncbi:hypothetical protein Aperf_G00000009341 [Anoplocephala perfoliata]